nr:MAG TPA: hypothetical protein [Caudoviricetes sp.]
MATGIVFNYSGDIRLILIFNLFDQGDRTHVRKV